MIYIQTLDKYWSPGKQILAKEPIAVVRGFEYFIALTFVSEVKKAIDTQKYRNKWTPLSPNYLQYKRQHGLSPHIWEATSQLKNNLKVYGSSTITIGWDKRYRHRKSRKPLWLIAREMELGTLFKPPRPLFRYIFNHISRNVRFYWNKFRKMFNLSNVTVKSIIFQVKQSFNAGSNIKV